MDLSSLGFVGYKRSLNNKLKTRAAKAKTIMANDITSAQDEFFLPYLLRMYETNPISIDHLKLSEDELYRFKQRDAKVVLDKSLKLLSLISSTTHSRLEAFHAICRYLQGKTQPIPELIEDFKRIGSSSVWGSAHIVCLRKKRSSCLTAKDFHLPLMTKSLESVPFLMALKLEVSKSKGHNEAVQQELGFYLLGNEMVKKKICVNFPLVFGYTREPCDNRYKKDFGKRHCDKYFTHYTLNELANGDLESWLKNIGSHSDPNIAPNFAFFQCLASLAVLNDCWGVVHNDAHGGNFIYSTLAEPTDFVYDFRVAKVDYRLRLESQAYLFKIWDFGMSYKRSAKTIETDDWQTDLNTLMEVFREFRITRLPTMISYLAYMRDWGLCTNTMEKWTKEPPKSKHGRPLVYSNLSKYNPSVVKRMGEKSHEWIKPMTVG